jgi:hypothetical protein
MAHSVAELEQMKADLAPNKRLGYARAVEVIQELIDCKRAVGEAIQQKTNQALINTPRYGPGGRIY